MHQHKRLLILLVIVITLFVVVITTSSPTPMSGDPLAASIILTPSATQPNYTPSLQPTPVLPFEIRIAWFYKPVKDENLPFLASHYSFFILTRKDEPERDQLLAMGIPRPVLQYFRFDAIEAPNSCTDQPFRNQVAYQPGDFCKISEEHPDWFLVNQLGQRISREESGKVYFFMDPGNQGWREFFLQRVLENMADDHWGGIFLDNVEVSLARLESRGEFPIRYSSDQEYRDAITDFLQYMRDGYFDPNGRLIYANLVAAHNEQERLYYLDLLDGTMHESWAVSKSKGYYPAKTWESQMDLAENVQAAGKYIVLISQGDRDDLQKENFTFASYLLINQGKAIFRYSDSNHYTEVWWYDNYTVDLGQPLGKRYKDGNRWYRDFAKGHVMVDPDTKESEIFLIK